jgi:hypothetical protein
MLGHAVMSVVQVFPSFVMLSLAFAFVRDGLPSIEMWFDHGEDRCCGLSRDGMVETVGFRQVIWFFMLESAKNWILGVDTPGQHVLPHVRYGMACLLVRYPIGCVSCSDEWGWHHTLWSIFILCDLPEPCGAREDVCEENLSTASGDHLFGKPRKAWHTHIVDLCNSM